MCPPTATPGGFREPRCRTHQQRGILDHNLVGRIPVPDPQLIRALLVPGNAGLGPVYFELEPVLAACGHLTHGKRPTGPIAQLQQHAAVVVGVDRDLFSLYKRLLLRTERLDVPQGPFPGFEERL